MKKLILLACSSLLFIQCTSTKSHNAHVDDLISVKKLRADTDHAYRKLKQLHPNLYWYVSKKDLDYKFDSLKTTIKQPMTSFAFYKKIAPIVGAVRQGHMMVYPNTKIVTKKESAELVKKGIGPFSQFEFEIINDKLFVVKNKSYDKSIKPGTEVVAINNTNPMDLIKGYDSLFTSDGYNQTFKKARIAKFFPFYYTNENGIKDSIVYNFKFHDTLKTVSIKRGIVDSVKTKPAVIAKKMTSLEKKELKKKKDAESSKKYTYGYNDATKNYNRNLHFMESDSSVAVMKIRGFSIGGYNSFYSQSFKKIKDYKAKTLIIDLRDNPGGRLDEIANLYSYLSDSAYVFSQRAEVVSKTSLLHADYFKGGSYVSKAARAIFSPLYVGYTFFKVRKDEQGKYIYPTWDSKKQPADKNAFNGKIYVLINGGSFSASCILSSNLKGSKRAYFVGEETGGAYNGTVAGRMPMITLPNSDIKIRMGLMFIKPFHKTDIEGRGIFPDTEIIPTLEDKINNIDPEMNWVLDDIKKSNTDISKSE